MASFNVQPVTQALTAQGGTDGTVTVASTTGYVAGAYGWIRGADLAVDDGRRVRIAQVVDATTLKLRYDERIDNKGFRTGEGYPSNQAGSNFRPNKVFSTVDVATTAALPANTAAGSGVGKTLTADAVGVLTVDGVATVLNDVILVKNEATAADNGIYLVTTEGTAGAAYVLTRATNFDQDAEFADNTAISVTNGTANSGTSWILTSAQPVTVDTDAITFALTNSVITGYNTGSEISMAEQVVEGQRNDLDPLAQA